ncbi:hypothetical protein ACP4OV_025897 [Aristida adscensionis]
MKLNVDTLKGTNFEIEASPEASVSEVKKIIEATQGQSVYPADQLMLLYQGEILKDDTTLEGNKVAENSFLVIMPFKAKASSSGASSAAKAPAASAQPAALAAPVASVARTPSQAPVSTPEPNMLGRLAAAMPQALTFTLEERQDFQGLKDAEAEEVPEIAEDLEMSPLLSDDDIDEDPEMPPLESDDEIDESPEMAPLVSDDELYNLADYEVPLINSHSFSILGLADVQDMKLYPGKYERVQQYIILQYCFGDVFYLLRDVQQLSLIMQCRAPVINLQRLIQAEALHDTFWNLQRQLERLSEAIRDKRLDKHIFSSLNQFIPLLQATNADLQPFNVCYYTDAVAVALYTLTNAVPKVVAATDSCACPTGLINFEDLHARVKYVIGRIESLNREVITYPEEEIAPVAAVIDAPAPNAAPDRVHQEDKVKEDGDLYPVIGCLDDVESIRSNPGRYADVYRYIIESYQFCDTWEVLGMNCASIMPTASQECQQRRRTLQKTKPSGRHQLLQTHSEQENILQLLSMSFIDTLVPVWISRLIQVYTTS